MDFEKEVMVVMDHKKKQYWQMTFAEMQQMMQDALAEAEKPGKNNKNNIKTEMRVDVKATNESKEVNGFPAKLAVLTMEGSATSTEGGAKGNEGATATMKFVNDMWNSTAVPGYSEYRKFYEQMKGKMSWAKRNPYAGLMNQPGMAEGFEKMMTEMAKIEGIPVMTITRVGMVGGPDFSQIKDENGNPVNVSEAMKDAAAQEAGATAGNAAGRAIGGRLGGIVGGGLGGGLGRLGRKKQDDAPKEQPKAEAAPVASEAPAGMSVLMEIVSDASNFSTAPIAEEVFAVPAGYKQTQPEGMKRKK
jgi:hypothetical protein